MNRLPLILAALCLCSCTIVKGPHGTHQFWGDYTKFEFTDHPTKGVHLSCDTMNHSPVARAHWHGITTLGLEAETAYLGGVPGVIGGTAGSATNTFLTRPTTRTPATPRPKP